MFGFADLSEALTAIGTVLTDVWLWIAGAVTALEDAVASSFMLQIVVGIAVASVAFVLLRKIVSIVKGFITK
jgi:pheromone shutdown protein TraB